MAETKLATGKGRAPGAPLPAEGENGLFTQSWFPICMSSEVGNGAVIGRPFLDGQVIVLRGESGVASVMSAYCPHIGADLQVGEVIGDEIRCAFHHWQYDLEGRCTRTGAGDTPPRGACLFKFPTVERWGLIWAFNGEEPLYEVPGFDYPDEELVYRVTPAQFLDLDPWVPMCNTLDLQHLKVVHGLIFEHDDPDEDITWNPYAVMFHLKARVRESGPRLDIHTGIIGSNTFYRSGEVNGRFNGYMTPIAILAPGKTCVYRMSATTKGDGSPEALREANEYLDSSFKIGEAILAEDAPILKHIRFAHGHLTKSDKALAKFFDHLRRYPRAHPSAKYIV